MRESIVLVKKDPLELTVEIDTEINIELSTGICGPAVCVSIPVSQKQLQEIIGTLQKINNKLSSCYKCENCGYYIPLVDNRCSLCGY